MSYAKKENALFQSCPGQWNAGLERCQQCRKNEIFPSPLHTAVYLTMLS